MGVDISVHALGNPVAGNLPPAPYALRLGGQKGLAVDTNSAVITLTQAAVAVLVATAKYRVDIQKTTAALDPANSPSVLVADQPGFYMIEAGSWYVKVTAYV